MSFILPSDMCRGTRPFGIQPMRGFMTERVSVWSKQPAKEVFRSSKVMPVRVKTFGEETEPLCP
jgi:hypothetical protein